MSDPVQDRIVTLIPSVTLKKAIAENDYRFSDIALLTTAFHCAPDFDSRIVHLRLLEQTFSGEIKAYTTKIIDTQYQMLRAFQKNEDGAVYELHIKDTPDAYDERYLCASYDAALKMISLFYKEYDCEESPLARYRIVKRRIYSGDDSEMFAEDYLGEAVMLSGRRLYSVDMNGFCAEDCDGLCIECNRYCVRSNEIPYPSFIHNGDAVKYRDHDGTERFGLNLQWNDIPTNECYIIPLDSEYMRYRDFKNVWYSHKHILAPFVDRISPDNLPDEMRENYLAYLLYLKENPYF